MTREERIKLYAALAAPFPEEAIERTDGAKTGRGYDTTGIKYQYVVDRLNEVLGVGGSAPSGPPRSSPSPRPRAAPPSRRSPRSVSSWARGATASSRSSPRRGATAATPR